MATKQIDGLEPKVESPAPANFMEIVFKALLYSQLTASNQQAVSSKTGVSLTQLIKQIIDALDPSNADSVVGKDLEELKKAVESLKGAGGSDDIAKKSAEITKWQNQLQADSTHATNQQNQATASFDQQNNRTQQDGSDLSQKMQLLASIMGITSMNANLVTK